MGVLPLLATYLVVLKGYIHTIAVYFYAYRPTFSGKKHCILHHFTLRFAPKRVVFCTKTHYVLVHIALYLAVNGS